MNSEKKYRFEKDLKGTLKILKEKYYGIHTQRALKNFKMNYRTVNHNLIINYAKVKWAAANANFRDGKLNKTELDAIVFACREIIRKKYFADFKLSAIQGGAGTSTNMNINEVIANIALEKLGHKKGKYKFINPIEHINLSQSTNDSYPTAVKITIFELLNELEKVVLKLKNVLNEKAREFKDIMKIGRTQLEDAVPLKLGDEFKAYSAVIGRDYHRINHIKNKFLKVNMGGTAIGTGVGCTKEYRKYVIEELKKITKHSIEANKDLIDGTQNIDVFPELSGILKILANNLKKIANDFRLMNSGPTTSISEIILPVLQAGSSIMPKKVNPVGAEHIIQIAFKIMGNDVTIANAGAGEFELNPWLPLIADVTFESIEILRDGIASFIKNVVMGIKANEVRCQYFIDNCPTVATILIEKIGYKKVSAVIKESVETGVPYHEVAKKKGYI